MKNFIPHKARNRNRREQWHLFLLGLASIYEGFVLVLSVGFLNVDTRSWLLFDVFED